MTFLIAVMFFAFFATLTANLAKDALRRNHVSLEVGVGLFVCVFMATVSLIAALSSAAKASPPAYSEEPTAVFQQGMFCDKMEHIAALSKELGDVERFLDLYSDIRAEGPLPHGGLPCVIIGVETGGPISAFGHKRLPGLASVEIPASEHCTGSVYLYSVIGIYKRMPRYGYILSCQLFETPAVLGEAL